jgi:2'-5' RNA ligase
VKREIVDEQCSRIDEDWTLFSGLTSMVNHWDRPGWLPGRRSYYWYLTFDSANLYLDPVPLDGLHLTLAKAGWADELTEDEVERVVRRATQEVAPAPSFHLEVGPLAGSSGAVRFSVTPWHRLEWLYTTLDQARHTGAIGPHSENTFRPHTGIAYCNTPVDAAELITTVRTLRTLPPVRTRVKEVQLVMLERQGRTYSWSVRHAIPLASR